VCVCVYVCVCNLAFTSISFGLSVLGFNIFCPVFFWRPWFDPGLVFPTPHVSAEKEEGERERKIWRGRGRGVGRERSLMSS
jgi:hypothetical protein